ncbi:MAG: hypothetical protein ABJA62_08805 [Luteimonas sp.]
MSPVEKRYHREFFPAMFGYCIAILGCTWLLKHTLADAPVWMRAAVSVLPMLPIALVVRAMVRGIRDRDELQRRIDLEAIAIASVVVGLGYFTLGLMAAADVFTIPGEAAMLWVFPLLCGVYGMAKHWAQRRYR